MITLEFGIKNTKKTKKNKNNKKHKKNHLVLYTG